MITHMKKASSESSRCDLRVEVFPLEVECHKRTEGKRRPRSPLVVSHRAVNTIHQAASSDIILDVRELRSGLIRGSRY